MFNEAINKNIRFDLLISPPRELSLIEAYHNALNTLQDINVNKKIIVKDQLPEYAVYTAIEIEKEANR